MKIHRKAKEEPAKAPQKEDDSDSEADDEPNLQPQKKASVPSEVAGRAQGSVVLDFNNNDSDSEDEMPKASKPAAGKPAGKPADKPADPPAAPKNKGGRFDEEDSDSEAEAEKEVKAAAKQKAKEEKPKSPKAVASKELKTCAVEKCGFPRFARGYCCVHIVTNSNNELPDGPQRVRNTINLWYRRDNPSKGRITWKFVHNGHRHEVVLRHDSYQNERLVKVDNVRIGDGQANESHWFVKFFVDPNNPYPVIIIQSWKGLSWRTDLVIDGKSFERGREQFMQQICQAQVAQLCEIRGDKNDLTDLLKERINLQQHWRREETKEKTKRGNYKSVVTWHFRLASSYTVQLEHGTFGGKRKISLNGQLKLQQKLGLLETNTSSFHDLTVDGKFVRVCIRDTKRQERRENLVDDEHPHASGTDTGFQYDLLVESVPFENCRLSTLDFADPQQKTLVRADREVSLSDAEMAKIMKIYRITDAPAASSKGGSGDVKGLTNVMKAIGM